MSIVRISRRAILDPAKSGETDVRLEVDLDCDGCRCGQYREDWDGTHIEPLPHAHIVTIGRQPDAGPRYVPAELNDGLLAVYLDSLS
jgi:hypothetical protein